MATKTRISPDDLIGLQTETARLCNEDTGLLRQRMGNLREEAAEILSTAKREGRLITSDEQESWSRLMRESDRIADMPVPMRIMRDRPMTESVEREPHESTVYRFIDATGKPVHVLGPKDRLTDLPGRNGKRHQSLSLGKAIIGLATGQWKNAKAEKLQMAESGNSTGGYLVQDSFWREIIDFARNQTAVIRAGAVTVPWEGSDRLVMARVAADPTFAVVGENAEIPKQGMTFDQIGFSAYKIATIISMSRELAADAPNAPAMIEQTLAKAFAVELDRLALVGSGSAEPNGLLNYTGVNSTDEIGAISWEGVHDAAIEVQNRNFSPSGYICSPTIGGDLDIVTTGNGINASKNWLGAPPSLKTAPRYTTKNCPDANLFIGDWSQFAIALRQGALLEVTTTGGDAFKNHQLWIKLTFRGDVGCFNANAFQILKGITT